MNIELALYQFLKENIRKSLSLYYLFNCWIKIPLNRQIFWFLLISRLIWINHASVLPLTPAVEAVDSRNIRNKDVLCMQHEEWPTSGWREESLSQLPCWSYSTAGTHVFKIRSCLLGSSQVGNLQHPASAQGKVGDVTATTTIPCR